MKNKLNLYNWCKNCRSVCCERVTELVPTTDDIKLIQKFLNKPKEKFTKIKKKKLKKEIKFHLISSPKGKCIFLKEKRCLIQKDKPTVCIAYPIFFYFDLKNKKIIWCKDGSCHAKLSKKYIKSAEKILLNKFIRKASVPVLTAYQIIDISGFEFNIVEKQPIPKDIIPKIKKVEQLIG